jgi:hypothetical protein
MVSFADKSIRRAVLYGLPFASLLTATLLRHQEAPFASEGVWWGVAIPAISILLLIPTVLVALRHVDAAAKNSTTTLLRIAPKLLPSRA